MEQLIECDIYNEPRVQVRFRWHNPIILHCNTVGHATEEQKGHATVILFRVYSIIIYSCSFGLSWISLGPIIFHRCMTVIYLWEKLTNHLEFLGSNMGDNHRWTYDGWSKNGSHSNEWMVKTKKLSSIHSLCQPLWVGVHAISARII